MCTSCRINNRIIRKFNQIFKIINHSSTIPTNVYSISQRLGNRLINIFKNTLNCIHPLQHYTVGGGRNYFSHPEISRQFCINNSVNKSLITKRKVLAKILERLSRVINTTAIVWTHVVVNVHSERVMGIRIGEGVTPDSSFSLINGWPRRHVVSGWRSHFSFQVNTQDLLTHLHFRSTPSYTSSAPRKHSTIIILAFVTFSSD